MQKNFKINDNTHDENMNNINICKKKPQLTHKVYMKKKVV
jgi:hypothetical protein